jgi:GxxExxY protein
MPYEDEDLQWGELDASLNEITSKVIGAAIEVHKELGPGLDESLYENAMARELNLRNLAFVRQPLIQVYYKGETIGEKRLDLIVERKVVIELKSVTDLIALHKAQLRTYLRITRLEVGLLINFNVPVLKDGIKRVISRR